MDFNDRLAYIDLPALPLPSTFAVYQAVLLHIAFSGNRFGTEKWNAEITILNTSLARFGMRWSIASGCLFLQAYGSLTNFDPEQYIEHIDGAMQEESRFRALDYGKM